MNSDKNNLILQIALILLGLYYTAPFGYFMESWGVKNLLDIVFVVQGILVGIFIILIILYSISTLDLSLPKKGRKTFGDKILAFAALWVFSSVLLSIAYKNFEIVNVINFMALPLPYVPFFAFTTFFNFEWLVG